MEQVTIDAEVIAVHRAKLDADMVYWGVEEVATLSKGDVEVPCDCDLSPGHYKYDAEHARFEPLETKQRRDVPGEPIMERALYEMIKAQGDSATAYCQEWIKHYEAAIDFKG